MRTQITVYCQSKGDGSPRRVETSVTKNEHLAREVQQAILWMQELNETIETIEFQEQ